MANLTIFTLHTVENITANVFEIQKWIMFVLESLYNSQKLEVLHDELAWEDVLCFWNVELSIIWVIAENRFYVLAVSMSDVWVNREIYKHGCTTVNC